MNNEEVNGHTIDTRFTWSGKKAEEFLGLVKDEYGIPLPYGAVRQFVRLVCAKYLEEHRKEKITNDKEAATR